MTTKYENDYHLYPVMSADDGFEGATKRYRTMPTPEDVHRFALLGLPKIYPLTGESIDVADAAVFLENALTEIEMSLNLNITPVEHYQSFDYIDGMFESNYTGMKLERWPATKVNGLLMKFPHTQTANPYQQYSIPGNWVALRRNRVNIIAAFGAVSVTVNQSAAVSAGGLFSYITGFARGSYQPAIIEVQYTAGFENDKLPSTVWDLVVTLASLRFLQHIGSLLFPYGGVNVSIDGINQSASIPPQLLLGRIQALQEQYTAKVNAITKNFGRTIKMSFIGA